jgi:hypothetical protein
VNPTALMPGALEDLPGARDYFHHSAGSRQTSGHPTTLRKSSDEGSIKRLSA